MNEKAGKILSMLILLLLVAAGVWQIVSGNGDFGYGLIIGIVGVMVLKFIKQKRIAELQQQGINPYDERTYAISYKASRSALVTIVLLSAVFVILGSMFGPEISVNPYNFLGGCLSLMVFIYIVFYYYYNQQM